MLVDRQVSKGRAAVRVITYDPGANWANCKRRSEFRIRSWLRRLDRCRRRACGKIIIHGITTISTPP